MTMNTEQHSIFYVPPDCVQGVDIAVRGPEVHHIRNVMRKKLHDVLVVTDGKGAIYTVRIAEWTRTFIRCRVLNRDLHEQKHNPDIACAFVPLKGLRSETAALVLGSNLNI